jgi:hypothetical protein
VNIACTRLYGVDKYAVDKFYDRGLDILDDRIFFFLFQNVNIIKGAADDLVKFVNIYTWPLFKSSVKNVAG